MVWTSASIDKYYIRCQFYTIKAEVSASGVRAECPGLEQHARWTPNFLLHIYIKLKRLLSVPRYWLLLCSSLPEYTPPCIPWEQIWSQSKQLQLKLLALRKLFDKYFLKICIQWKKSFFSFTFTGLLFIVHNLRLNTFFYVHF